MANLAIKGHPTRGKEVIQFLEILGGKSNGNMKGYNDDSYYFIAKDGLIYSSGIEYVELDYKYTIFTLEEVEKLYPYKVGDKVTLDNKLCTIIWMCWECDNIYYQVQETNGMFIKKVVADELKPYKEQETIDKTKFPYEIGTRVSVKGTYIDKLATIVGLSYNSCACMQYEIQFDGEDVVVHYPTNLMTPIITEQSMEERDEKTVNHVFDTDIISFDIAQKDKYELDLQGKFEVVLREGKYYAERIKPQYPKDYEECCKVLGISRHYVEIDLPHPYQQKMFNLFKLHICRDAYWKLAGKEMGLDKPWEPDWNNGYVEKYYIYLKQNEIEKSSCFYHCHFLAFPTKEMLDAFFGNFEDLIKECKELL